MMNLEIKTFNTFFKRLTGIMFKHKKLDFIICFPKCNSIHTFFCFQNLDIVMTDKSYKVLYIYKNFKPWRIIWPKKGVYYTFELPNNTCKLQINDNFKNKILN